MVSTVLLWIGAMTVAWQFVRFVGWLDGGRS